MVSPKDKLFRTEALEQAASPEQIDQIMQVVRPKSWLPLAAIGSLVAAGVIWGVVGRVPVTVSSKRIQLLGQDRQASSLQQQRGNATTSRILLRIYQGRLEDFE